MSSAGGAGRGAGRGREGRGTEQRDGRGFRGGQVKTMKFQDGQKGVNENLPFLRYNASTGGVPPIKVREFLDRLKIHAMSKYSRELQPIFDLESPHYGKIEFEDIPVIPRGTNKLMEKLMMKKYELECGEILKDKRKLEKDKFHLFGDILGQLSTESVDQIRAAERGYWALEHEDPLELIKAIISTHLICNKANDNSNLYSAQKYYLNLHISHTETIEQFVRRFDAALGSLMEAAVRAKKDDAIPDDQMQTLHFLDRLRHHPRYASYAIDVELNRVPTPRNYREAAERANLYLKSSYRSREYGEYRGRGVFLAQRGRGRGNNGGRGRGRGRAGGKTAGPSKDAPCHTCGATDHWANQCPQGEIKKAVNDNKNGIAGGDAKAKNA